MEAGLPTVLNVGLPVLEAGLARGYDFDRVGGGALLAILANSTDTNIIARSSRERQLALTEELKAFWPRHLTRIKMPLRRWMTGSLQKISRPAAVPTCWR